MVRYLVLLVSIAISSICHGQYIEPQPLIGNNSLKTMIKNHMEYPPQDLLEKRGGTIMIEFETDIEGKVIKYRVVESISPKIDSSAISLFEKIIWKPATYDLLPVKGNRTFSIKYNPKQYTRLVKKRGYDLIDLPHLPLDSSNTIYSFKQLDVPPRPVFSSPETTLNSFIYSKLVYPEAALKTGIEGEVVLDFIIEKNGLPSNINAVEHLGGGCTGEAIRLIESISWYPGLVNGKAVRSNNVIKINFNKSDSKDNYIPNQQGSGI